MFPDLYDGFLLNPDDGAGSGAGDAGVPTASAAANAPADGGDGRGPEGTTVSTADAAVADAAPNPATTPVAPAAPAPGAPSPVAAATPPAAPVNIAGVREYARSLGIDPATYADDKAMLRDVFAAAQQAQAYRSQLQGLTQQHAALMQRLTQIPVAQPAPQPAAPPNPMQKFFNPPEYNASWEQLITRDAQGNPNGVKPGAPYDILPKYLAHQNYRKEFADRLLSNPVEALGPMVQHMAQEQANKLIETHLQTYQDRTWTDNFVAQNSAWLHQRDVNGNTIINHATGKPMLSPVGQRFSQYVVEAERLGVRDIRAQENYARSLVQRDLLMGQQQQQAVAPANQAAQQAAIAAGNRRLPNQTGTLPGSGPIPATVAQNPGLSLKDQLAQAMQQHGITDNQVALDG